ncbi:MAG: DUF87 domain-containing protein [Asgard group archaeon]|nr:DUF87 domain-containing protein [Asgard group archaeon]
MKTEEKFYSYKKGFEKQIIYSLLLLVIAGNIILLGYIFFNKVSYGREMDGFDVFSDNLISFFSTKLKNWGTFALTVIIIIIIFTLTLFLLIRSFKLFFLRERVILAKITRISNILLNDQDDVVDYPNASLSKALAKVFKQVTFHQKATVGKITNISIFASQTKYFSYPKPKSVFHQLAGICKTMGIEIEPYSQEDYNKYSSNLSIKFGNPISYQLKGLGLVGEPANQHIQKFNNPVDKLVETIVNYSKDVEIHTFSTIRQGSTLRYWLKKRTLPRTKKKDGSERNLSPHQLHRITETNDMAKFGYVNGEVAVLIKGLNGSHVEEIQDKMIGNLGTVYDGITRNVEIKKINPMKILKSVINHELIINKNQLISGYSARAIINVYRKPISGIPFVKDIMNPPSERRLQETHPIMLGETGSGEVIRTGLQDHVHHCGIFGTTGYGKSEWIQAEVEQILEHYPDKRIMIFDFDGEYARVFLNHPDFLVLEANNPDAPLHINPFEGEGSDLVKHADSLFSYFNEILSLDQKYGEFTPPQKDILWEGIIATVEQDDSLAKNYAVFNQKVREYIEANKYEFVRGDMSAKSLLLKLKFYQRELRNIVMCNQSNFTMDMLEHIMLFSI